MIRFHLSYVSIITGDIAWASAVVFGSHSFALAIAMRCIVIFPLYLAVCPRAIVVPILTSLAVAAFPSVLFAHRCAMQFRPLSRPFTKVLD
jgi:hypothetical protein